MKYQFASTEWVEFAHSYVLEQSSGNSLDGINIRFSEVFTNAPTDLDPDSEGQIGWYLRIVDNQIEVDRGFLPDPDLRITADYQTVLPLARLVFAGDEEAGAVAQKTVEAAMADGRMSRSGDDAALAQVPWLANLHDDLARHTL